MVIGPVEALAASARPGGASVLLVDDEPWVRLLVSRMLTYLRHAFIEAATAAQAEALAAAHPHELDLLLTDVVLPDYSGFELARRLRRRYPTLKVLFITGHAEESAAVREGLEGAAFLNKPFRSDELEAALRDVLTAEGLSVA